jgi:hypothetical protein
LWMTDVFDEAFARARRRVGVIIALGHPHVQIPCSALAL